MTEPVRSYAILDETGRVPVELIPDVAGAPGGPHPDLADHTALGLATQADVQSKADSLHTHATHAHPFEPSGAVSTHAQTAHGLSAHAIDGAFHSGATVLPTQGQKNALAGTSGTPGTGNEFVTTQDPRNSDARTPLAHSHPGGAPVHATLANGATAMNFGTNSSVKVTPTANATYTTTVPPAGTFCTLLVLTSGTTSRTITFGTGFKTVGTLATGTVSARVFAISFRSDGTNLYETGRTAAMAA